MRELADVVGEPEVGVLEEHDRVLRRVESGGEDTAGDGLAAADLATEQAGVHRALGDEVAQAGEGLVVLLRLEEETPVGDEFEGTFAQLPVVEGGIHAEGWRAAAP
jgi:hypothetical protein